MRERFILNEEIEIQRWDGLSELINHGDRDGIHQRVAGLSNDFFRIGRQCHPTIVNLNIAGQCGGRRLRIRVRDASDEARSGVAGINRRGARNAIHIRENRQLPGVQSRSAIHKFGRREIDGLQFEVDADTRNQELLTIRVDQLVGRYRTYTADEGREIVVVLEEEQVET